MLDISGQMWSCAETYSAFLLMSRSCMTKVLRIREDRSAILHNRHGYRRLKAKNDGIDPPARGPPATLTLAEVAETPSDSQPLERGTSTGRIQDAVTRHSAGGSRSLRPSATQDSNHAACPPAAPGSRCVTSRIYRCPGILIPSSAGGTPEGRLKITALAAD